MMKIPQVGHRIFLLAGPGELARFLLIPVALLSGSMFGILLLAGYAGGPFALAFLLGGAGLHSDSESSLELDVEVPALDSIGVLDRRLNAFHSLDKCFWMEGMKLDSSSEENPASGWNGGSSSKVDSASELEMELDVNVPAIDSVGLVRFLVTKCIRMEGMKSGSSSEVNSASNSSSLEVDPESK